MVYKVLLILIVSSNPSLPCWPKSCFTSLTMEICKWHLLVTIYYYIKTLMTLWGWKIMWLHSFSWLVLWYWKNRADHCFPSLQDSLSPSKRVCLPWHKGVSGVIDGCPRRGTLVGTAFCITMKWKAKIRRAGSLGEKKNMRHRTYHICLKPKWIFCDSRTARRKEFNFTRHQLRAKCRAKHIAIHLHKYLEEYSDDDAEAREITSRSQGHMAQLNGRALMWAWISFKSTSIHSPTPLSSHPSQRVTFNSGWFPGAQDSSYLNSL